MFLHISCFYFKKLFLHINSKLSVNSCPGKEYYLSHESGRFKKRYILQEYIKRIEKEIKTIFLNFLFLIKKNDLVKSIYIIDITGNIYLP